MQQRTLAIRLVVAAVLAVPALPLMHGPLAESKSATSPLVQAGEVHLPARLVDVRVASDRAGDNLAVLTADGGVHLIRSSANGGLAVASLPAVWGAPVAHHLRLVPLDWDHDGLVDLRVQMVSDESRDLLRDATWPDGVAYESDLCAVYRQSPQGWQVIAAGNQPRPVLAVAEAPVLTVGGLTLLAVPSGLPQLATDLVPVGETRPLQRLRGWPLAAGDLNGDGQDELLTVWYDGETEAKTTVEYRLWQRRGGRFGLIWQASYQQRVDCGLILPEQTTMPVFCDLDCDGQAELIVPEAASGRLTVHRWAADR